MPLASNRELIQISKQAYQHLKKVVGTKKASGVPVSGTMLASEAILNIPLPQPEIKKPKRAAKAVQSNPQTIAA